MDRIVLDKLIAPYINSLSEETEIPSFSIAVFEFIKGLAAFLTVKGLKIGGTYRHFKGTKYMVTGVTRDCNDWDGEYLVEYVQEDNFKHRAVRKLSEFLEDVVKPEYKGPRFTLI